MMHHAISCSSYWRLPWDLHESRHVEVKQHSLLYIATPPSPFGSQAAHHKPTTISRLSRKTISAQTMTKLIPPVGKLKAVLFDIDGTICQSDPIHLMAFQKMLQEIGFQGGVPIDEEFFQQHISGRFNHDIGTDLFPSWDEESRAKFLDEKECLFRRLASEHLKPVAGLYKVTSWVEEHGLHRAAVTNAPRENAEMMISVLGLKDFFEHVVVGTECERPKPFPDPYLKALQIFGISSDEAFVFEDSPSGLRAAVGAGLPAVALTTDNPGSILLEAGASFLIENYEDPALWDALQSKL